MPFYQTIYWYRWTSNPFKIDYTKRPQWILREESGSSQWNACKKPISIFWDRIKKNTLGQFRWNIQLGKNLRNLRENNDVQQFSGLWSQKNALLNSNKTSSECLNLLPSLIESFTKFFINLMWSEKDILGVYKT